MNLLHLKYAVEIEKTGSITKAANNLFMGQPNLSKAIKELENEIGITIFRRTTKGVAPTEKGGEFLGYAKAVSAGSPVAWAMRRKASGWRASPARMASVSP